MRRVVLLVGLLCFLAGVIFLVHPEITYQKRDEVAKIGPITATVEKKETAKVPVAATVSLLLAGLVLVVLGLRTK